MRKIKMRIAVLNLSGNVGKTTIARDVFSYRLPDYNLITIESINCDGKESTVLRGDASEAIFVELLLEDNLICDVGSSNVENFLISAAKEPELLEHFDLFVIPTTPEKKQQVDTLKTASELVEHGVKASKIKVVFNKVDERKVVDDEFSGLAKGLEKINIKPNYDLTIFQHDLYTGNKTLSELMNDKDKDFKQEMEAAKKKDDKALARKMATAYARQKKVSVLDKAYQEIYEILV